MCDFYNAALEQRLAAWDRARVRLTAFDQGASIAEIRSTVSGMSRWTQDTFVQVLRRLEDSYTRFLERARGKPRYKSKSQFRSLRLTFYGEKKLRAGVCKIPNVSGRMRVVWHRPLPPGTKIQKATVLEKAGHWYIVFLVKGVPHTTTCGSGEIGVDLGLDKIITLSNGASVASPKFELHARKKIRSKQRELNRSVKGSARRARKIVQFRSMHDRIRRQRISLAHKLSSDLVRGYQSIAFEDLDTYSMSRGRFVASVRDASWRRIIRYTTYKAESAGGRVVLVDPAHTSQDCPNCGARVRKPLSLRRHLCPCGCDLDRDVAAANVVLARAFGAHSRSTAVG